MDVPLRSATACRRYARVQALFKIEKGRDHELEKPNFMQSVAHGELAQAARVVLT